MKPLANTTNSQIRPGISLPRSQMAGYLVGVVGTAAFLWAPQAEAAVTAVTFSFGPQLKYPDGLGFFQSAVNGGTFGYMAADTSPVSLGFGNRNTPVYNNGSYGAINGLMRFFSNGTFIGTGANGANLGYARAQANQYPNIDFTSDQLNKNIGFKTSTNNWGWANVSWTEADKTLAFNSAYVESVANTAITVGNIGAVPEPSRALLALAGLGGVALRRRRKQAA
jgi:hypothetical protein